jgi:radical SAM-linked protein
LTEGRVRLDRDDLAEIRRRFEQALAETQNATRLVGAEFGAAAGFTFHPRELRVVLAFPDAYEVGISNQALQILYHLAQREPGTAVERAYLPWVDVIARLRQAGLPLLTLESWTPVRSAHVLGISLQHELNYTNVLELLDLSGIPLRAAQRNDADPLVVGGGPATTNFAPVAPFFDAVFVGEAEEAFPRMLRELREGRMAGEGRDQLRARLSRIPGVFVPGVSSSVSKQALVRLSGAPYPTTPLVPLSAGVHDRAWVEIMRGCSRGCRFCQAGMWYRPVRERPQAEVLAMAAAQLAATGHEELALSSLSTTDYSAIGALLEAAACSFPEVRVALPSLRVDSAAVRLGQMVGPGGTSITLAPEAGSQRMRDVINKNVSEEDILGAAREAFAAGRTTLKLYFMIGLPTEKDEDVEAIVTLCRQLRDVGRQVLGPRTARLQLNVSVTNFIPKPFTPFQWTAMAERGVLRRRQEILRGGLSRLHVRLALHGVDNSYLEAALARGGEETAAVIEAAWRGGARFDSWTEHEAPQAWAAAFAAAGLSAEELATTPLEHGAALPWDLVEGTVTKEFLLREYHRALAGDLTGDCRWSECSECGACEGSLRPDVASGETDGVPSVAASAPPETASGGGQRVSRPPVAGSPLPFRYVLTFSVTGRARFVAHLDSLQLLRRAIRRAGGRLALSEGMRPKPLLALALPRGVGVESRAEICEFVLAGEPPASFAPGLQEGLPDGFRVLELQRYHHRKPAAARVTAARYRVTLESGRSGEDPRGVLEEATARYTECREFMVERRREGRIRQLDVREYVPSLTVGPAEGEGLAIEYVTKVTPRGAVRPDEVVFVLAQLVGGGFRLLKTERLEIVLS